jgi:two-component system, NtrC family, nitrogen regulation sensor histidine kinase GlnL
MTISSKTAIQLYDNLSTAVILFDRKLRLTCINSAGEDLLLVSCRRVIGQKPEEILPDPPTLAEMVARALDTNQSYTERRITLTLPNTRSIKVDCKVTPIINNDTCSEIIVELIDTDSHQRALREENQTLLQDTARESLRGMAHEVKNPLGGIRGAAQLLERELSNGNPELKEYTRIIIQEADRLRNFIDRVLTSELQQNLERVNIHELLEYVCSLVIAEYGGSFNLTRDYDPSLPSVTVDSSQIIQSVLNVMKNAVQAAGPDGNVWIRSRILRLVTLQKRIHKLVVRVDIIDDGPGIPPEIENGIFYPMITGRPEGTGLGLTIAQSLINKHGGIIEYERSDEKTTFSIYLPTEQDHD